MITVVLFSAGRVVLVDSELSIYGGCVCNGCILLWVCGFSFVMFLCL